MLFQVKRGDPWANYSTEEEETVEETQIEPKKTSAPFLFYPF